MSYVVNEQTFSGVCFNFTQADVIGCFKLYDEVLVLGILGFSTLDTDCWSCRS